MDTTHIIIWASIALFGIAVLVFLPRLLGVVYIPHTSVGIIEKLWSARGSLAEGRIIATEGEAGVQSRLLRGGLHFGLVPWQYRIHRAPLVTVAEGRIGYVYAKDGAPLEATQTLGATVQCNHFQEADAFLEKGGQRGRQRAILREGVYAINTGLFVVLTETAIYSMEENGTYPQWQQELAKVGGYRPVVIGGGVMRDNEPVDMIGVVSVQDGPTIPAGDIIAPAIAADHNYFQNAETFLANGGCRGRQLQVLTDGTFFINRWFATIELGQKTLIPIGYVGVVVSYYGGVGSDTTGDTFRYGEQVNPGEKGVWKQALTPGKYPLNPYAVKIELVPTVNFVLRWITGQSENHRYDDQLATIEIITADGYEPLLPLSLVLHIDYQKAPSVVQRFGDVKRLITQTLDPILTAYFRDVAQSSTMLELLTHREEIQKSATTELSRRFQEFDINCVAVLIGRPETRAQDIGNDPIEKLFDQLRIRRLAEEQRETYSKQQEAAVHLKALKEAEAVAGKQAELTQSKVEIEVAANRAEAQLAEAQRMAKRDITLAEGRAKAQRLEGEGEAAKITQVGLAEASVFQEKIKAYGDPRLFALRDLSERFANSTQPLVPERVFISGGKDGEGGQSGLLQTLLSLLVSEKSGMHIAEPKPARPKHSEPTKTEPS
ncbi:MAG: SPFH domain-containing protein [Chthoniobacterales bacterium]